jgi:glycosyltransferase involved in cell wall biosynthesis
MNILIVSRRFPPFPGGAENQLARIAAALALKGHNVRVFTGLHNKNLLRAEENNGVMIKRFSDPGTRYAGTLTFLFFLILNMISDKKFFDIVLASQVNETSATAVILSFILGKRSVFRPSSLGKYGNFEWTKKRKAGFLYRAAMRLADAMVGQTEAFIEEAVKNKFSREKIVIIPNMPPDNFFGIRKDRQKENDIIRILWCGRLNKVKNPLILCDVVKKIIALHPGIIIDVVGDGELKESLVKKITKTELSRYFDLHGYQKDVRPFFQNADIYLLTSTTDAMPNTILEAIVSKVPVVATNVDGVPLMIKDGKTGLLAPSGSPALISQAVSRLIENPALREKLSDNAQKDIQNSYSPELLANKYEIFFENLLSSA